MPSARPTPDLQQSRRPLLLAACAALLATAACDKSKTAAPTDLVYAANPAVYTVGEAVAENAPSSEGGEVSEYAVAPALPAGLSLDAESGVVSGTPTAITAAATYVVTASNEGGSTTAALVITVNDVAPSALEYATNPATYTKGTAVAENTPSSAGGAVVAYSVSPALPAGLSLDEATGVVSGTPTELSPEAIYLVTAENTGGSASVELSITVNDVPPSALVYAFNPVSYTRGTAVPENAPSSEGGPVTSYSVAPPLPAGLTLDALSGVLSGTPAELDSPRTYLVTARNSGGATTAVLELAVNDVPPTALAYSTNPATYTKGVAIAANSPSYDGGDVTAFSVEPSLPAGLGLDGLTGVISGTPTGIVAQATYVVTALNSGGETSASLVVTVNDAAPTDLVYAANPAVYTRGSAITANSPSNGGGAVVSYSVSPVLPAGLSLDTSTGAVSGTPTGIVAQATYVVTATNTGGSTTANLVLTVNDAAPASLAYAANPAVYTRGSAITANSPSSSGGAVVSYSVSPALPAGLSLNTSTGAVSGTPTAIAAQATYVVTGTNTGGSTTANLVLTVNDVAPSALAYFTNPAVYTRGSASAANLPSSLGGPVVSYSVSPALPAGLTLHAGTGIVSGTPTAVTAQATYVVTATNTGGSTTANLVVTVNDVAPSALAYTTNPAVYTKGAAIAENEPSSLGGPVVSYSVSPALPAGLSLDAGTGVVSGTPTVVTAQATYVVTATNTGGSATANLVVTVVDACGDGNLDAGEECDDGNLANDDGCSRTCVIERCGDQIVQFSRGESCDDGNTADGDGCSATCQTDPFATTAPVLVSGALSCTTAVANAARKISIDPSGTVYAVMACGTGADVVVSSDRGATFTEPLDLSTDLPNGPVVVSQVAVAAGPSGVGYVAMMLNTGEVYLRITEDGGQSWGSAAQLGQAASTSAGLSLQAFNDDIYVGFSDSSGIAVASNYTRGAGPFTTTSVAMTIAFFDLLYDVRLETLAVCADTPAFHVRASADRGATFAGEVNPPGQEYYSDWAIGNGQIFVSGTNLGASGYSTSLYVIPTDALSTSTAVVGLPAVTAAQTRSIAADDGGNAFVASQLDGGGVQLDRLTNGAGSFDAPRSLSATGGSPVAAPLPGQQGAAVIFTDGSSVYVTIQTYTEPM